MNENSELAEQSKPGYVGYTPFVLGFYDFWVHVVNNHLVWKCPTRHLISLYNDHITSNHLEIGLGTGYLLDKCVIPGPNPRLVFCDMNPNCLEKACHRLSRYVPQAFERNVLSPIQGIGDRFTSVGMNYVLHCLPGDLASKRVALQHAVACLEPGGVLFGATLLGREVPLSLPARLQMKALNSSHRFSNLNDSLSELKKGLGELFVASDVSVRGCAALFWGRTGLSVPGQ